MGVSKLLLSAVTREMVGEQEEGKFEEMVGQEWVGELVGLFLEKVGGKNAGGEHTSLDKTQTQQEPYPQDPFSPISDLPSSFQLVSHAFLFFHQTLSDLQGEEGNELKQQVEDVAGGMGRVMEVKGWGKGGKGGKGGKFNPRFKKRVSAFRKRSIHSQTQLLPTNITPRKGGKKKKGKGGEHQPGDPPEEDLSSSVSQVSSPSLSTSAPSPIPFDNPSSLPPTSLPSPNKNKTKDVLSQSFSSGSKTISNDHSLPPLLGLGRGEGGGEEWEAVRKVVEGLLEEGVLGQVVEVAGKVFFFHNSYFHRFSDLPFRIWLFFPNTFSFSVVTPVF